MDYVPNTLAETSSLRLSKKQGPSTTARTWSDILLHFKAILSFPENLSLSSAVMAYVSGTLNKCFSPVSESVSVFICMTSRSSISFMKRLRGNAHPSPIVYRYSACSISISKHSKAANSPFSASVASYTREGTTLGAELSFRTPPASIACITSSAH